MLFYFKYAAFLVNSVTSLFGVSFSIPVLELPIGISFYTFQVLTYTVDVYRDKSPVQRDPFKLMLYVSCFPQLIAGPIVQYSDVAVMLDERESTPEGFTEGMKRFAVGLSKKVLLANVCGLIIEELPSAAGASGMSVLGAWYISVLYSLQLYFDFSGYSDMAIGMGRIFGFTYKENFNYPYISKSASEFWHRWHISLGSFFRDYVYIPGSAGNRCGRARTALNLAIVWALTGLWHGASWNFVIWGLYYGVLIILEKLVLADLREKLPGAAQHIAALLLIVVGWTVFYYTDMGCLGKHLGAMFGIGAAGLSDPVTMAVIRKYTVLPLIAAIASLPILPRLKAWLGKHEKLEGAADIVSLVCLTALMLLSIIFIVGQSYNPFIYFRF